MDVSKYYRAECSIRCSLQIIPKILNILRIVPKRLELFSETCFADWLKLKNFWNEPHLVHLILQCQSGSDDSLENVYFSIRGTEFTFGAKEFCLVTGFKFGNAHLTPNVTNPSFVDRVFKDNRGTVKLRDLKGVFDRRLNELNDEDVVRVCLLLLVELGFKGTEAKNNLDRGLLDLVNDLKAWNDYPWGSYLWAITYGQLKNALSKNHRDDPQRLSCLSYSLKGFIFAFKTWILEIFPAFKSIAQKEILIPRAVGWNLTTPITWYKALDIVQGASSKPVNISPTHLEEKTDWWNCSLCYWNSAKQLDGISLHLGMANFITLELLFSNMDDQETLEDLNTLFNNRENALYRILNGSNQQYHYDITSALQDLDLDIGDFDLKDSLADKINFVGAHDATSPFHGSVMPVNVYPISSEEKTDEEDCIVKKKPGVSVDKVVLDLLTYHNQVFDNIFKLFHKDSAQKKTADELLTYLNSQANENFQLLVCCVLRCKADRNSPYHPYFDFEAMLSLAPRRQKGQRRPTTASHSQHKDPKTSDKVKHVESIKYKVEDMIDKGIEIQLSFHSSEYLTKEFWVQLLVIHSNGWFTSDHIRVWNSYMYFSRPRNARWTLMPPDFVYYLNKGSVMKHFADGSSAPYPPIADVDIMYIPMNIDKNHWILLRVDILKWTITVYDSLRDKRMDPTYDPELTSLATSLSHWLNINVNRDMKIQTPNKFSYIIPEKLAQQVNGMDCGAWCCIFLERLIKEKEIFIEEDTTKTAQEFRERFALLCLEHDKSKYQEGNVSKATPTGDDNPPTKKVVGDNTSSPAQQATGVSVDTFPKLVALEALHKMKEELVKLAAEKRKAAYQGDPKNGGGSKNEENVPFPNLYTMFQSFILQG